MCFQKEGAYETNLGWRLILSLLHMRHLESYATFLNLFFNSKMGISILILPSSKGDSQD